MITKKQMRIMRQAMEEIKPVKRINVDITEEEAKVYDEVMAKVAANKAAGRPFDYDISRLQLAMVSKFITPFTKAADIFIQVQKGKGNSEVTIKHYEQSIRKLKKFFAWYNDEQGVYDKLTNEERIEFGGAQPIAVFESDNFESGFREFLTDEEGVSLITVNTYFRDYRVIAYWLMEEGFIEKRNITIRNVEADIKECYTDAELDKLLRRPHKDCDFAEYRTWVVIHWLLATGNRCSTVCNVKISDVDFEENMININVQKNKKKMRIPLETKLRKILLEYIDEWLTDDEGGYYSTYLFPSSFSLSAHIPMNRSTMGHAIAEYNTKRGVKKTSTHLFRHTFTKNWIVNGGDLHSLQKILGHSRLEMVTKYANLYGEDLKPKVEAYSVLATHKSKNSGKMIKRKGKR